jgi:hypothetical protein
MQRKTLHDGYIDVDIDIEDPDDQYLTLWCEVGPMSDIQRIYMSKIDALELAKLINEAKSA